MEHHQGWIHLRTEDKTAGIQGVRIEERILALDLPLEGGIGDGVAAGLNGKIHMESRAGGPARLFFLLVAAGHDCV